MTSREEDQIVGELIDILQDIPEVHAVYRTARLLAGMKDIEQVLEQGGYALAGDFFLMVLPRSIRPPAGGLPEE